MSGQTVNDILIGHRPHADALGFGRMIRSLKDAVDDARTNREGLAPSDARYETAIRQVALIQTQQQLGHYDRAKQCWNDLRAHLDIGRDVPDDLRRVLGEVAGDHAATVFFHLKRVKSRFGTAACQRHLDDALEQLKLPANRAEFHWRHCINDLVAGRDLNFAVGRDQYYALTQGGNPLVARSVMYAIESLRESLRAGGSHERKRRHAEAALWLYLDATKLVEASRGHLDHPDLTTHTILCTTRYKILLSRRVDFLKRIDDREAEYRQCLKLIRCLMTDAQISPEADGFLDNTMAYRSFIDECRPPEPTSPGIDPACVMGQDQGSRAERLQWVMTLTDALIESQ